MDLDHHPSVTEPIDLQILGQRIRISCGTPALRDCLWRNFAALTSPDASGAAEPNLSYTINADEQQSFVLERAKRSVARASDLSDLVHYLEKDLIVDLQKCRAELFFLHSAAVEWRGKAILLAADAGSGKSTTTWGLMHHSVGYLSDELSPIDLSAMKVFAYPHALCLKSPHRTRIRCLATSYISDGQFTFRSRRCPGRLEGNLCRWVPYFSSSITPDWRNPPCGRSARPRPARGSTSRC
jgi:hypothetical protein